MIELLIYMITNFYLLNKKLHENFDSAKDPVVMTIPEPNANFSPTIGDQ